MSKAFRLLVVSILGVVGCSDPAGRGGGSGTGDRDGGLVIDHDAGDEPGQGGGGGGSDGGGSGSQLGCDGANGCYTVYAHSDHELYLIDLSAKTLVDVGPFRAPDVTLSSGKTGEDVITDLAVSPDNIIYAVSNTSLYTADPSDGHVTLVGPITDCGSKVVALSFVPDGSLYTADGKGAFCRIDLGQPTPEVVQVVAKLSSNLAISGDLVAVADGTMYGTAIDLADASGKGTQASNLLIKIDPKTGAVTEQVGGTSFGRLYGVSYGLGKVFGFTHDGSGDVITIDPKTGQGTLFNTFEDSAGAPISFAGAGVNAMVPGTIM